MKFHFLKYSTRILLGVSILVVSILASIFVFRLLYNRLPESKIVNTCNRIQAFNRNSHPDEGAFFIKALNGELNYHNKRALYRELAIIQYYTQKLKEFDPIVNDIIKQLLDKFADGKLRHRDTPVLKLYLYAIGKFGTEKNAEMLDYFINSKLKIDLIDEFPRSFDKFIKEFETNDRLFAVLFNKELRSSGYSYEQVKSDPNLAKKLLDQIYMRKAEELKSKVPPPYVSEIDKHIILAYLNFFEVENVIRKLLAYLHEKKIVEKDGTLSYRLQDVKFIIDYLSSALDGYVKHIYSLLGNDSPITRSIAIHTIEKIGNESSLAYLKEVRKNDTGIYVDIKTSSEGVRISEKNIYLKDEAATAIRLLQKRLESQSKSSDSESSPQLIVLNSDEQIKAIKSALTTKANTLFSIFIIFPVSVFFIVASQFLIRKELGLVASNMIAVWLPVMTVGFVVIVEIMNPGTQLSFANEVYPWINGIVILSSSLSILYLFFKFLKTTSDKEENKNLPASG